MCGAGASANGKGSVFSRNYWYGLTFKNAVPFKPIFQGLISYIHAKPRWQYLKPLLQFLKLN